MVEAIPDRWLAEAHRRPSSISRICEPMATLALSLAGQVAGGALGGPIGATIGRALGALAGSAIDNAIFGERRSAAGCRSPAAGFERGRADPAALWLEPAERQHHLGDRPRGDRRRRGWAPRGRRRRARRRSRRRSRSGCAKARCIGSAASGPTGNCSIRAGITLRFYRGTETQDGGLADRGEAGRGRAGLSRALLHRVRAAAAGAVRQPHSAISRWSCAAWWASWSRRSVRSR